MSDIIGFGNNVILFGDLDAQYIPFIKIFLRAITGKDDYWYSLSLYLGSGTALTYAYYCINPFNLLYLIEWLPASTASILLITGKIALAAASFQFFVSKALNVKHPVSILFSLCYALGSFTASMYTNIIWLDAVYILPFLTYLTMKASGGIKKQEKATFPFISLTLTFAYLFITNFYIGFMVGIFEALAFILSFFRFPSKKPLKDFIHKGIKYASSVVLAASLCAAALMPAAYFLYSHMASDNENFKELFATIPDLINSMFIGSFTSLDNNIPFMYCGLAVLLLAPFFFTLKNFSIRDKILTALLLIYYLLSMIMLPLYEFMHVFDFPNWYAYRFSFCISFMLVALACVTFEHIGSVKEKPFTAFGIFLIILYSIMIPICNVRYTSYQIGNNNVCLFINTAFISFYILLFLLQKKRHSKINANILFALFSLLVVTEIVLNLHITEIRKNETPMTELAVKQWLTEGDALEEIQASDNSLYRISVQNENTSNAPAYFGYAGLNTFSSSDDYNLRRALYNLGIAAPNRVIYDTGYTPVTYAFTGTKYSIKAYSEKDEFTNTASENPIPNNEITPSEIKEYDSFLPLVFMADSDILNYQAGPDPFINQNNLMSCLSGTEQTFFTPIDRKDILEGNYNTVIMENPQVILFSKKSTLSLTAYYVFAIPHDDSRYFYACFSQDESVSVKSTMYVICETDGWYETGELKKGNIVRGALLNEDNYRYIPEADPDTLYDEVAVYTRDPGVNTDTCRAIYFYEYELDDKLKNLCSDLTATAPELTSFSSSDIKATVHVTDDRPILFTTIPYDEGWSIYCDGKEVETIATVENAFLGAELPKGDHEIELKYTARFAKEGSMISIVAAIILIVFSVIKLIFHITTNQPGSAIRKNNNEISESPGEK